jgi:hypothetical protein
VTKLKPEVPSLAQEKPIEEVEEPISIEEEKTSAEKDDVHKVEDAGFPHQSTPARLPDSTEVSSDTNLNHHSNPQPETLAQDADCADVDQEEAPTTSTPLENEAPKLLSEAAPEEKVPMRSFLK